MMSRLIKVWIPTAIAVIAGAAALIGYVVPAARWLTASLTEWAVIVAAFALMAGIVNVLHVHVGRLAHAKRGSLYSVVLLLAAAASFAPFVLEMVPVRGLERVQTSSSWVFKYVIRPTAASLGAVLAFTLALAGFRLLRGRANAQTALFAAIAAVVLLGSSPLVLVDELPLSSVREWLVGVLALAGTRGLLLGVAIGTMVTGLRILMGADLPHSES
jgi:hypothetical protein